MFQFRKPQNLFRLPKNPLHICRTELILL